MFKIGQKVVCVRDTNLKSNSYVKKGEIYTILSNEIGGDGNAVVLLEETDNGSYNGYPYFYGYNPNRFVPLNCEIISNKEIIKEMITEKSDLPIKESVLN